METYKKPIIGLGTTADIPGVLSLQDKNLYAKLSVEERKNGFVTTPFTEELISEAIGEQGLFLAKVGDEVVAYVYAGSWNYFFKWPMFEHMMAVMSAHTFHGDNIGIDNSFQYGPICIDSRYRGTGLINQIFEAMRLAWSQKYHIGITFINQINIPSFEAHTKKLNFEVICPFFYNNNEYYALAFDPSKSVVKNP